MKLEQLRKLSGLAEAALPVGQHFTLSDEGNMKKAVDALLEAGLAVDLALSMGTYYFNFKNEDSINEARKVVSKVIDKKKESQWSDK